MRTFKHIPFILGLGLASVGYANIGTSYAATDHDVIIKEFKVEVDADSEKGAHIMINSDGDHKVVKLDTAVLSDPQQLEDALSDLPSDIKDTVMKALSKIDIEGDGNSYAFAFSDKDGEVKALDEEQTFIIKLDKDSDSDEVSKVIRKFAFGGKDGEQVFEFKQGGGISKETIIGLLKNGEFSADELDLIQQALDSKR